MTGYYQMPPPIREGNHLVICPGCEVAWGSREARERCWVCDKLGIHLHGRWVAETPSAREYRNYWDAWTFRNIEEEKRHGSKPE